MFILFYESVNYDQENNLLGRYRSLRHGAWSFIKSETILAEGLRMFLALILR